MGEQSPAKRLTLDCRPRLGQSPATGGPGRVKPIKAFSACWWTQCFKPVWRPTQAKAWCYVVASKRRCPSDGVAAS
ncbi:hypothetical protein ACFX2F_026054 [Malus domestica]